jgi:hypothetical protein
MKKMLVAAMVACAVAIGALNAIGAQTIPQSTFTAGRDPFFPESRVIEPKPHSSQNDAVPATTNISPADISVGGISAIGSSKYAVIGNHSYAEGETDEIKSGDQTIGFMVKAISSDYVDLIVWDVGDRTVKKSPKSLRVPLRQRSQ